MSGRVFLERPGRAPRLPVAGTGRSGSPRVPGPEPYLGRASGTAPSWRARHSATGCQTHSWILLALSWTPGTGEGRSPERRRGIVPSNPAPSPGHLPRPHQTQRSLLAPFVRRTLRIQACPYADVARIAESGAAWWAGRARLRVGLFVPWKSKRWSGEDNDRPVGWPLA